MGRLLSNHARRQILDRIAPTDEEVRRQEWTINLLKEHLTDIAREKGLSFSSIAAQGSTGLKQTQIRGASDIDLFVALHPEDYEDLISLPRTLRDRRISRKFAALIDEWFIPAAERAGATRLVKAYSQHPYLSLQLHGLDVDVIACFDLSSEDLMERGPITAVDRTIHHTRYILNNVTPEIRNDIRILKSFVRASHAYGDSCAVGQIGLTGYALEVLTIIGNGFEGAAKLLQELGNTPVDPFGRDPEELLTRPAFENDFAIVIDPVDPERNLAASFSKRAVRWVQLRLSRLSELSSLGREPEVIDMILEKPIPTEPLPSWLVSHCRSITFVGDPSRHYTLYRDKIYRLIRALARTISQEGTGEPRFGQVLWEVYFEGHVFAAVLLVERTKIEPIYHRRGPPVELEDAARSFRKHHRNVYEKDGYLWTEVHRRWTDVDDLIRDYLKKHPITGLQPATDHTPVTARAKNVLYRYVMRIERWFPLANRQEYKEAEPTLDW